MLGEPGVFSLWANAAEGRVELGGSASAVSATLHARLPDPPAPELGALWTPQDAARASLRAVLWRTTGAGRVAVAEWKDFGATVSLSAPGPGRYSLEVWLTPLHLEAALGKASSLAGSEYRWILTNAITLH